MVTAEQKTSHQNKRITRLEQEVVQLQDLLQTTFQQSAIIASEHAIIAEKATDVVAVATLDDANPDVYVVPAEQMNRLMFVLKGE